VGGLADWLVRLPRSIERFFFQTEVSKIVSNSCGMVLVLKRVHRESQTDDNEEVCIVVHQEFIRVAIANRYSIFGERGDLQVVLKYRVVKAFVLIEPEGLVCAFAEEYTFPVLLAFKVVRLAVCQYEIISAAEKGETSDDSSEHLITRTCESEFVAKGEEFLLREVNAARGRNFVLGAQGKCSLLNSNVHRVSLLWCQTWTV
jgi:hypothetical protein